MRYRYNFLSHFFIKDWDINILIWNQKIRIWGSDVLYDFLVYCVTHIHIFPEDIAKYGISASILELLIEYRVLVHVAVYQSWIESLSFHELSSIPGKLATPVLESDVEELYNHFKDRLHSLVNQEKFKESDYLSFDKIDKLPTHNIDFINSCYHSTKTAEPQDKIVDHTYLNSSLVSIHGIQDNHFVYWSGWWFYSIFSFIITRDDFIKIVDKYKQVIYQIHMRGIFEKFADTILLTKADPKTYNAIVLLISDTEQVFWKYGNRWYRYIMMESWSIGLLYRMLYSERWYTELGWYRDKQISELIGSLDLFTSMEDLMLTHLILLNH